MHPRPAQNYILFSDVHLGADLVQHVQPWTLDRLRKVARIDRELAAMLDWYREHADPERPWRLIIAGDLVDFMGMSIAPLPGSPVVDELTPEEQRNGLGSTGAQAASKMRAVAKRHTLVFNRLAAFVADGHSLVLVRGNHDVDFHWETARGAFVEALVSRLEHPGPAEQASIEERVEFYPWFYYEEGLLYVEHGHQFDAMCSYHHLLAPVSPRDPRRTSWSFSDLLLRGVVRPTRGLPSGGHEHQGLGYYVRLGFSFGVGGALRLGYRYLATTARALVRWRAHVGDRAREVRAEHERRMQQMATRVRVGMDQVRALASLWPKPITGTALSVLRSMFLDRVLLTFLTVLVTAALVWLLPLGWWGPMLGLWVLGATVFWVWTGRVRVHQVNPAKLMRKAAARIAEVLPARYVVMGHTHEPLTVPLSDTSTYVNLGNWGAEDPDAIGLRTHLVLRWQNGAHRAEFLRWEPGHGPVPHALPDAAE